MISANSEGDPGSILGSGRFPGDGLPTPIFLGFPCGSAGQESTWNAGELCSIPGLGRSPGEQKGYPLQYSCLENSMDRGALWAIVHEVTKESDSTEWLTLSLSFFSTISLSLSFIEMQKPIPLQLCHVLPDDIFISVEIREGEWKQRAPVLKRRSK